MKYLFADLWANIRKSPFLFLFLFIQIVITSLILYIVIANYHWAEERNNSAQIAWGNKEYIKLTPKTNVPYEIRGPLTFSSPRLMASTEEDYLRNLEIFNKVEEFYSEAKKIDGLTIIPNQENWDMVLSEEKAWNEEDKHYGMFNMFVDQGTGRFNALNIFFVGEQYLDYFNVKLSEGEYFKEKDYLYDNAACRKTPMENHRGFGIKTMGNK